MRENFSELVHHAASLAVTQNRNWVTGLKGLDDMRGVTHIRFPRIERCHVAVAMTTLIPSNDTETLIS